MSFFYSHPKGWNRSDAQTYVARSKRSRRARRIAIFLGIAFETKAAVFPTRNDVLSMTVLWAICGCCLNASRIPRTRAQGILAAVSLL